MFSSVPSVGISGVTKLQNLRTLVSKGSLAVPSFADVVMQLFIQVLWKTWSSKKFPASKIEGCFTDEISVVWSIRNVNSSHGAFCSQPEKEKLPGERGTNCRGHSLSVMMLVIQPSLARDCSLEKSPMLAGGMWGIWYFILIHGMKGRPMRWSFCGTLFASKRILGNLTPSS